MQEEECSIQQMMGNTVSQLKKEVLCTRCVCVCVCPERERGWYLMGEKGAYQFSLKYAAVTTPAFWRPTTEKGLFLVLFGSLQVSQGWAPCPLHSATKAEGAPLTGTG